MRLVLRPREEERLEDTPANSKSGELRPILEAIIGGGPQWSETKEKIVILIKYKNLGSKYMLL